jgi:hypothetical protein
MSPTFINTMTLDETRNPYLPLRLPVKEEHFRRRQERIRQVEGYLEPEMKGLAERILALPPSDAIPDLAESGSVSLKINEIEEHLLLLTAILSNVTEQDRETIFLYDTEYIGPPSLDAYMSQIDNPETHFRQKTANMRKVGGELRFRFLPIMRGKLAVLEYRAVAGCFDTVCELIRLSPRYLGCPIIQRQIYENQVSIRYGAGQASRIAQQNVKKLNSALQWRRNQNRKRNISYWNIRILYEKVFQLIDEFRHTKTMREEALEQALYQYSLPMPGIRIRESDQATSVVVQELLANASYRSEDGPLNRHLPPYLSVKNAKEVETIVSVYTKDLYEPYKLFLELPHIRILDAPAYPEVDRISLNARLYEVWDWIERGKIEE